MIETRYVELDWLRVVLIFAVFLHHCFMPFNGDGWHIMNAESSKLLDDIMVYFEQVRLQTLFFIAGVGSALLLRKQSWKGFLSAKLKRLFIPFVVAMMIIVPPQHYFEHIAQYTSLIDAYSQRLLAFSPNHLWFIEFLLVFMLLAPVINTLFSSKLCSQLQSSLTRLSSYKHGLFLLVVLLVIVRCVTKWINASYDNSLGNISQVSYFLFFFLAGMWLIRNKAAWLALAMHRRTNLYWLLVATVIFYGFYIPDYSPYLSLPIRRQIWVAVGCLVSWSALLVMLGYGQAYLSHSPKWLRKTNELIYPFYIVHQTVIVAFAFYIVKWQSSIFLKAMCLTIASMFVCMALCLAIGKGNWVIRVMFGLKTQKTVDAKPSFT
ncbi:acyltransferase [Thalassotalea euphylliae]|uniref:acyltransferase family protein n=1 Tax=Thalassotalea euphylliae TaxID=1655234 RepID=UPI003643E68D